MFNLDSRQSAQFLNLIRLFLENNKNGTAIQIGDVTLDTENPMPVQTPSGTALTVNATIPEANKLEAYTISDIEEGITTYAGFIKPDGKWYIMKITNTDVRYVNGTSAYATSWENREGLAYLYFNQLTW